MAMGKADVYKIERIIQISLFFYELVREENKMRIFKIANSKKNK